MATSTTINGKNVNHGDTIISFRGEEFTFDHTERSTVPCGEDIR